MRIAYKDQPFSRQQLTNGRWRVRDDRLGLEAEDGDIEAAELALTALVVARLESMTDEEFEAHLARCEQLYVDEHGNSVS
jgi:hypothetical protein